MSTPAPATPAEITEKLIAPLLRLYRLDVPDADAFLAELRRHVAAATPYQLEIGRASCRERVSSPV